MINNYLKIFFQIYSFIIGCRNFKKRGPLKAGCQKRAIEILYGTAGAVLLILFGCRTTRRELDTDYSYYLGPDYKAKMRSIKKTSTVVTNHVSCLDGMVLVKTVFPAFAPAEEYSRVPILKTLFNSTDCIYMPRGGNEEARAQALQAIRER